MGMNMMNTANGGYGRGGRFAAPKTRGGTSI